MVKKNKYALDKWAKEIENYKQLTLSEAKELYIKAMATEDSELKNSYMNELILGTLYVIHNYIERNNLIELCNTQFDMNDLISSFSEVWIKVLYEGRLLDADKFSALFHKGFIFDVYRKLGCSETYCFEQFDMSYELFVDLFYRYIECRNKEKEFYYDDLIGKIRTYVDYIKVPMILPLFEKIYDRLNISDDESLELVKSKISTFIKYYITLGLSDSINSNIQDHIDYENEVIHAVGLEHFVEDVDAVLMDNPRNKDILHLIYGLDDQVSMTRQDVGVQYGLTRGRICEIEAKDLRLLRRDDKINTYKNYVRD